MRTLLVILSVLILAPPASAINLTMIGQATPKVAVYRQSEMTAVVYDARPEFGVDSPDQSKKSRDALRAIGVRVVRCALDWGKMESSDRQGLYDSIYQKQWDQLVGDCRTEGICLCVDVVGEPPALQAADAKEKLATFLADMAERYPSVAYWEVSAVPNAKESDLESAGKAFADVLKSVYPAVKTANPSAHIVCAAPPSIEFARGIYSAGGQRFFDVMTIQTTAASFAQDGKAFRSLMSEFGDSTTPMWCVVSSKEVKGDGGTLQTLFDLNNAPRPNAVRGYFTKVLVGEGFDVAGLSSGTLYKWLTDNPPNATITARPRSTVNVVIPTKTPMIPVGYDYKQVEGGVEVQRVVVDSLLPTEIHLMYAPQPPPTKPGVKPAPKKNSAPVTDPWDI